MLTYGLFHCGSTKLWRQSLCAKIEWFCAPQESLCKTEINDQWSTQISYSFQSLPASSSDAKCNISYCPGEIEFVGLAEKAVPIKSGGEKRKKKDGGQ